LSHVFVDGDKISGVVDIDSIRRNILFKMHNQAKDLAGFNHPGLPLSSSQRKEGFHYYIEKMNIKKRDRFLNLLEYYTRRRWKE